MTKTNGRAFLTPGGFGKMIFIGPQFTWIERVRIDDRLSNVHAFEYFHILVELRCELLTDILDIDWQEEFVCVITLRSSPNKEGR